jgi:DNA polymerase V
MELSKPLPLDSVTVLRIPFVTANIEAGFPSPADDHLEGQINLHEELIRNPAATFMVRVNGDSMRDAGISTGDVLLIDRSITPVDRHTVVAMVDGGFTVKNFRKKAGMVFLEAANAEFPPIQLGEDQELVVWGVVTYGIHKFAY